MSCFETVNFSLNNIKKDKRAKVKCDMCKRLGDKDKMKTEVLGFRCYYFHKECHKSLIKTSY